MRSEHERAIHYFERAYTVDPTFVMARVHRGILLSRELGRHEEALAEFDKVLHEDPRHEEALFNRSLVLQSNGRFAEALTDLEAYLALTGGSGRHIEAQRLANALRALVQDLNE